MGSETVTIGGREFRVGATYAPKRPGLTRRPRQFQGFHPFTLCWMTNMNRPGGTVTYGVRDQDGGLWCRNCSAVQWLRWAGDEVAQP